MQTVKLFNRRCFQLTVSLHGKLPPDISRQPHSLSELDRWKATEFRQFLLYTGPLVLKAVLYGDMYKHFLLLHTSVSILLTSNGEFKRHYLSYARDLLTCFVENAAQFMVKPLWFIIFTVYLISQRMLKINHSKVFDIGFVDKFD